MAPDITWRTSIQAAAPPNLRKKTDGLKAYWERMDQELWDEVQRMRTRQIEGSEVSRRYAEVTPETSTSLCRRTKVPPPPTTAADRLNSLWVLDISLRPSVSFQPSLCLPVSLELSIHALVSMLTTSSGPVQYMSQQYEKDDSASRQALANIFNLDLPDEAPTPSQRELCSSMWEHQQTTILEGLNDPGRKRLVENASRVGKRWLNVVPYFQPLRISNQEVATGLHDRTLVGSSLAICSLCGSGSPLGHDELCRSRNSWAQPRHDSINRIIHRGLQSIEGAVVSIEPRTLEGQRRNDLRVRGRLLECSGK
ncbi:hypothetical protein C350_02677 [Cryptococcus neoformans MW-RSA36]|nr:hypothetical protein C350_02677 [Cryptococcus neoformans var. grubii MW-RSA36]